MKHIPGEKEQNTARKYLKELEQVVNIYRDKYPWITVPLLLAIVSRETFWGWARGYKPKGDPAGRGDWSSRRKSDKGKGRYHGHGFFQIDIDAHPEAIKKGLCKTVEDSVRYVIQAVLVSSHNSINSAYPTLIKKELLAATIAAYNCGPGAVKSALRKRLNPDTRTSGRDYSKDVLELKKWWTDWYMKERQEQKEEVGKMTKGEIGLVKKIEDETKDWLEKLVKEAQDAAIAFLLAVIMGDSGRRWALTQGGDPEPEKIAFEWGLKIRPVVYQMIMTWFRSLLQGAVADKDFVNKIFSVIKRK